MTGSNDKPATSICDVLKPTYWSEQDTPETILKAKEDNAVWKDLCGGKGLR